MSWIQQQARRNQGGWVAGMPMSAPRARPRAQNCPLVGLVGACCSGCAEGKGCAAKDDPHVHAALTPIVGETSIPWDQVEKSNATIDHVNEAAAQLANAPDGSPEALRFKIWSFWYTGWHVLYVSMKAQVDSDWVMTGLMFGNKTLHGELADVYKQWMLTFNEQLKALEALQVQASADPIDTRSPAGKAFDETIKGVIGGTSGVLGTLTTALTWVAVAGAVGLVLVYAGPALLGVVTKRFKK